MFYNILEHVGLKVSEGLQKSRMSQHERVVVEVKGCQAYNSSCRHIISRGSKDFLEFSYWGLRLPEFRCLDSYAW